MIIVALTGGIGTGKSFISKIFEKLDVPVYDADSRTKALYKNNSEIISRLCPEAVSEHGIVDTKILASIVFKNKELLDALSKEIHPLVKSDFGGWMMKNKSTYCIIESAIIFESGFNEYCSKIITVTCPLEVRITRVQERDHRTREEIMNIINSQGNEKMKVDLSNYVIDNNPESTLSIETQVKQVHEDIISKANTFEINGKSYIASNEKVENGDELFCVVKGPFREGVKTKFGDKGIVDLHFDRVTFPNGESFVYWSSEFLKLKEL